MNTGSKSVTVKYFANYWRVCLVQQARQDLRHQGSNAEAAAASLRHEAPG